MGFKRVSCINATLPLSQLANISDDLCSFCKLPDEMESRVVVGTLDLNQCTKLPEEITGAKPKGIGADFARAYISNVCVAKELQRIGLGYAILAKSKLVAKEWGNNFFISCFAFILVLFFSQKKFPVFPLSLSPLSIDNKQWNGF